MSSLNKLEQKIAIKWKNIDLETPVLSICCTTYNHEKYIRQALDSFLMQETNFPFEIIVRDDASTDKTAEIIREYEKKYPNIIKPIYEKENMYSKGVKPSLVCFSKARGDYIALCEGDDYWTDPKKLQIQVDFLENNDEYVISGHNAFIIDSDDNVLNHSKLHDKYKKDFTRFELMTANSFLLTLTWVFRNIKVSNINEADKVLNMDTFLLSYLGQYGESHYHNDIKPAAYRIHKGGIWSKKDDRTKYESNLNTIFWIYSYYKRVGDELVSKALWEKYSYLVMYNMPTKKLVEEVVERIFYSKLRKIKRVIKKILVFKR